METRLIFSVIILFGIGGGLMALSPRRGGGQRDWTKYVVYAGLIIGLLVLAWLGRPWLTSAFILIAVQCTVELRRALGFHLSLTRSAVTFGLLLVAFGHLLWGDPGTWFPSFALVLILVASTDAFSQLAGKLLGHHQLCPRISPGKTVEGLAGGLVAVMAVSGLLAFLSPELSPARRATLALLTALGAIVGDLVFSGIKRRAGIKDFGSILPGHGGALDRFDSLIVAAPVYVWTRLILTP